MATHVDKFRCGEEERNCGQEGCRDFLLLMSYGRDYPRKAPIWPPSTTMVVPTMKRPASATRSSTAPSASRSWRHRPTSTSSLRLSPTSHSSLGRISCVHHP